MIRSLLNAEQEIANYKEMVDRNNAELQDLANKHNSQILKTEEIQNQFHVSYFVVLFFKTINCMI